MAILLRILELPYLDPTYITQWGRLHSPEEINMSSDIPHQDGTIERKDNQAQGIEISKQTSSKPARRLRESHP